MGSHHCRFTIDAVNDMDLSSLEKYDLIMLYGQMIDELEHRNIIRSKNVVGDIGEYLAVDYYTKTPGFPKLLMQLV